MRTLLLSTLITLTLAQQQQPFLIQQQQPLLTLTRIHTHSLTTLNTIINSISPNISIWSSSAECSSSHTPCSLDIAASPSSLDTLLNSYPNLNTTTLQPDIHSLIQQQSQSLNTLDDTDYNEEWHQHYHSYQQIQDYLNHIALTHPAHAQLITLGHTYENRSLTAIKLGHFLPQSKKIGVLVIANQHAREWISAASALHLIHQILNDELDPSSGTGRAGKSGWKGTRDLLDIFDITILPLSNPDGYAYSWTHERMWRKNRQPTSNEEGCVGIDVNSNWDANFQGWPVERACSEAYAGSEPFEAYESRAIAEFIKDEANGIGSVVDLHSYGQMLTYPFAFSCSPSLSLPDEEDLLELSFGAVRAMRDVHARTFRAGRHCDLAWEVRGSALDWSYGYFPPAQVDKKTRTPRRRPITPSSFSETMSRSSLQPREGNLVKWSFALELRDEGTYGFLLPEEQIRPSGQEAGALMRYMLEFIAKREKRI
ncbi:hypothetical protein CF319_g4429 [Tilletia indica]|nr:hypothetical protein CF319_g4429 [Tilletia indica]